MKILFVVTLSELGGAQKYVCDLAVAYAKEGHDVVIAAGGEKDGWLFREISKFRHFDISTYHLPNLKRSTGFFQEFQTLFTIISIIKREKPDVLHLNSTKVGGLGGVAGIVTNVTSVYTVHGLVLNEPLPIFLWAFYWLLEKIAFAACDKIVVISTFDEQSVLKFHLSPKEKLSLVPLTIDPEQLNFLSRDKARQVLNHEITKITKSHAETIPSHGGVALATGVWETPRKADRPGWVESSLEHLTHPRPTGDPSQEGNFQTRLIGTIANFYPTKDLPTLIDAARIVVEQKPEAKFIIIGDGPLRKDLALRVTRYALRDSVFLLGRLENASQYLPGLDLFVLSSVKEGLPQVLWEVLAAGIPVVSTNIGGIPDIYENNFNCHPEPVEGSPGDGRLRDVQGLPNEKTKEMVRPAHHDNVNWLLIPPRNPQLLAEKILFALDNLAPNPPKSKETLQKEFQEFVESTKSIYQLLVTSY